MLFVRTIALRVRSEIRDLHKVIPHLSRKTRWQTGARGIQNFEAALGKNLFIAACSNIKIYAEM
jgi:hypothetical protein